jgi:surfeit locus 1 family protein
MRERFIRPRPVAWFFFLLAFGGTLALGSWQVQRLHWKQGLITTLAEAQQKPPITTLPKDEAAFKTLQFYPAKISGTWIPNIEFQLAPRYLHDQFGYAIIAPLKLNDGRIVLINRGWVPGKKKDIATRPETRARGAATVKGLIRVGSERSYFTPANQPEKNIWFGRDIAAMAEYAKLSHVAPAMVDAVGAQKPDRLPIPSDGTIRLRNDHLSYVITWYGIALGVLVIFLVYHRRK